MATIVNDHHGITPQHQDSLKLEDGEKLVLQQKPSKGKKLYSQADWGGWHLRNISMHFSGHTHINKQSLINTPTTSSPSSHHPLIMPKSSAMNLQPIGLSMSRTTSPSLTLTNSAILLPVTSTQMEQNMPHLGNQVLQNQA